MDYLYTLDIVLHPFGLIFILCFSYTLSAQEFSFTMRFVDRVGHQDSIVVGYDALATDSIDFIFDKKNIIDYPWDSTLDVRISNGINFSTKKNILKNKCFIDFSVSKIQIKTPYWPITAYWESSAFVTACVNFSWFSSSVLNRDIVLGPSNLYSRWLAKSGQVSFSSNIDLLFREPFSSIISNGDTLSNFWIYIGSAQISPVTNITTENQKIYPNPSAGMIHFQSPQYIGE